MAGRSSTLTDRFRDVSLGRLAAAIAVVIVGAVLVFLVVDRVRGGGDLGHLVYVTPDGIFRRDIGTGREERLHDAIKDINSAAVRPDGEWAAYEVVRGKTTLLELDTGGRRPLAPDAVIFPLSWDPAGRLVAMESFGQTQAALVRFTLRGEEELILGAVTTQGPYWLDRDRYVALVGNDVAIVRVHPDRAPQTKVLVRNAYPVTVSDDRKTVVYVDNRPGAERVVVARIDGNEIRAPRTIFRGKAFRSAVSPDGAIMFAAFDRDGDEGTWVVERGGRPRLVVDDLVGSPHWTKDGSSLVYFFEDSVYIRGLDDERGKRLTPRGTPVLGFAVVT